MAIGWLTSLSTAETYFSSERLETSAWDALNDDEKTRALTQAYNRIRRSKEFTIPTSPTSDESDLLCDAQCETAYYLAVHAADEDNRKGLQAQGVSRAGIVQEDYDAAARAKTPLPPVVYDILDSMRNNEPFFVTDIERDEDHTSDDDLTDLQ